jgi:HK97 family phage major capsid protein
MAKTITLPVAKTITLPVDLEALRNQVKTARHAAQLKSARATVHNALERTDRAIKQANYPELFGVQVDAGREREISAELARRSGRAFKGIPVPLAALSVKVRDAPPELLRNLQRKDVISSTTPPGGPGGSLIPTYLDPAEYIDVLRPAIAVRQLGARVLSNLSANLNLPKMRQATSSGWFAENTAIMRSDEEFEVVELRPRHCGAILEASRNMIGAAAQSSPDLEAIMRNDLAAVLARRVDLTAISGAGTPIEPLGIITIAFDIENSHCARSHSGSPVCPSGMPSDLRAQSSSACSRLPSPITWLSKRLIWSHRSCSRAIVPIPTSPACRPDRPATTCWWI